MGLTVRQIAAIAVLPGTVTLVVPALLVRDAGPVNPGWSLPAPLHLVPLVLGAGFIAAGLLLMGRTMALFVTVGRGTLAPWDPPRRLVVRGVYRHVRNPMISGVFNVLLGEALLLGSLPILCWFGLFALLNLVYIPLFEEPGLARRFGADYALYTRNVPRWIPRRTPWDLPQEEPHRE